jgi:hypothetical protein
VMHHYGGGVTTPSFHPNPYPSLTVTGLLQRLFHRFLRLPGPLLNPAHKFCASSAVMIFLSFAPFCSSFPHPRPPLKFEISNLESTFFQTLNPQLLAENGCLTIKRARRRLRGQRGFWNPWLYTSQGCLKELAAAPLAGCGGILFGHFFTKGRPDGRGVW